jgi:hypothetical protein
MLDMAVQNRTITISNATDHTVWVSVRSTQLIEESQSFFAGLLRRFDVLESLIRGEQMILPRSRVEFEVTCERPLAYYYVSLRDAHRLHAVNVPRVVEKHSVVDIVARGRKLLIGAPGRRAEAPALAEA